MKSALLSSLRTSCSSSSSSSSSLLIARRGRIAAVGSLSSSSLSSSLSFYSTTSTCLNNNNNNKMENKAWDPAASQYKYWNREAPPSAKGKFQYLLQISPESIVREARILSLSDTPENDHANKALHGDNGDNGNSSSSLEGGGGGGGGGGENNSHLPLGSKLLGIGTCPADFDDSLVAENPNVVFVSPSCPMARLQLPLLLHKFPTIEWIHVRSAGIDFIVSDELARLSSSKEKKIQVTNAKGQFSSSLAEYAMMACGYFAKDLPRLMRQQKKHNWEKYDVEELRGKTMGIVGYGDIGRATAKLASVYGMRVVALRRNPQMSVQDPLCDVVYGTGKESLKQLMSESDYIVCSAPSTVETRGMVSAAAFEAVKENAVFINVGRGPVVDEEAMIQALQTGKLKGAALDVFTEEPLPESSPLWNLDNVLLSPHNMDQTATFMHEATEFFVNENLPRFICGEELLNPVDTKLGY